MQRKYWELMLLDGEATKAIVGDVDGDGQMEVVSVGGVTDGSKGIHVWKKREKPSFSVEYSHKFVDRWKKWVGTDILAADVDSDGIEDIICAAWWYKSPLWERYQIPGVSQVINSFDLDGDGREEFIATKPMPDQKEGALSSDMYWLKPIDPERGKWEEHHIGTATAGKGVHGWPHGSCVGTILPGGRIALIARGSGPYEMFQMPDDPGESPWPKRDFTEGEGCASAMIPYDMTGNGLLDLVAEWKWLENLGNGTFKPHDIVERFSEETGSGLRGGEFLLADINGDGNMDIVFCEEHTNWGADPRHVSFARVGWLEHPGDPKAGNWQMHVIDWIRSPHSLAAADLDGDGELEMVCGEHDPFKPQRSRCRIFVYKKAEPSGRFWTRHLIDDRFDNHVGTRLIRLAHGKTGIISHRWVGEFQWVHLWE